MTVGIGFEQGRVDIKLSSFRRETRSKDMRLLRRLTGMRDRKTTEGKPIGIMVTFLTFLPIKNLVPHESRAGKLQVNMTW
jgi:hypothetical protein